ncbi:pyridoxal-dependent aspartate 1-decarboxylase PanP [Geothermobacter hydrogeniphilus]|uniref:Glutamate decarboxylase n=1 Tax=Geothermobacter hydrogeniphilus TaxID=1969733 RepID=A0A1X0Y938_9BACT|nr:putative pyridoxal-dependent aspartate 1-decarboxylase [Geothermobacter hydrogeniphilus]ORJ61603.1 glutamate decarboxylase [Geothermobacter hydrogeniphilus]
MTPQETAKANLENLYRIFTIPEAPDSTLGAIDQAISRDVAGFLQAHIVALERSLEDVERDFADPAIPEEPTFVSEYTEFIKEKLVAHSVHTAAPGFAGHMTSALPYFMLPLSRIMTALNQNLVKVETSKAFTPMERQVLAMLHRLIYAETDDFYRRRMHDSVHALGAFCSGGTIANMTALWTARNLLCAPDGDFGGIAREGYARALDHLGCRGLAVFVSRRGHYSLTKAVDLIGLGSDNLVRVDTDADNRINLKSLRQQIDRLRDEGIRPLAIVGIAGTTETGNVDSLEGLADIAGETGCHFHVDAAWGGPTLFSSRHRHLLAGIERADSVTLDAHKQLYVPMGAGMVLFKNPVALRAIEHHAAYILREGSKDLGSHTLEGSRPGKAMLVHAGLSIIGRKGYELLIDLGIDRARMFAGKVRDHRDFELMTEPELNILTYRYLPDWARRRMEFAGVGVRQEANSILDQVIRLIQKYQRESGKTFVSRTTLQSARYGQQNLTVFRVVLANPLTDEKIIDSILEEQCRIACREEIQDLLDALGALLEVDPREES